MIIFADKNKKNGGNFPSQHVNNCYIGNIALRKTDICERRKVLVATRKRQSRAS